MSSFSCSRRAASAARRVAAAASMVSRAAARSTARSSRCTSRRSAWARSSVGSRPASGSSTYSSRCRRRWSTSSAALRIRSSNVPKRYLLELGVECLLAGTRLRQSSLRRLQPLVGVRVGVTLPREPFVEPGEVVRGQSGLHLAQLCLQPLGLVGRLGLSLQRAQLAPELAQHRQELVDVPLDLVELAKGALAPLSSSCTSSARTSSPLMA